MEYRSARTGFETKHEMCALLEQFTVDFKNDLEEHVIYSCRDKPKCVHRKLRSAYRSLTTNLPFLYTYQTYPDLHIPHTTNVADGTLSQLPPPEAVVVDFFNVSLHGLCEIGVLVDAHHSRAHDHLQNRKCNLQMISISRERSSKNDKIRNGKNSNGDSEDRHQFFHVHPTFFRLYGRQPLQAT